MSSIVGAASGSSASFDASEDSAGRPASTSVRCLLPYSSGASYSRVAPSPSMSAGVVCSCPSCVDSGCCSREPGDSISFFSTPGSAPKKVSGSWACKSGSSSSTMPSSSSSACSSITPTAVVLTGLELLGLLAFLLGRELAGLLGLELAGLLGFLLGCELAGLLGMLALCDILLSLPGPIGLGAFSPELTSNSGRKDSEVPESARANSAASTEPEFMEPAASLINSSKSCSGALSVASSRGSAASLELEECLGSLGV
mmetsp:Transcript_120151/g.208608  ORF Transcript_120151/g.208608 Transcript_120151/m.208608 type:complete len:257 (+) Transcript_120151:2293-3063(+)